MPIITVHNAKGGVGKTVTTLVLSTLLGQRTRTLAVDLDPIGSLSLACGMSARDYQQSTVERCFMEDEPPQRLIFTPESFGFDLLPAGPKLTFVSRSPVRHTVKDILSQVAGKYDLILVDTQPTESPLTLMALNAADYLLIPCITDFYSIRALSIAFRRLQQYVATENPALRILGVLPTQFRVRTKLAEDSLQLLRQLCSVLSVNMFTEPIPYSVRYAETGQKAVPIRELTRDPKIIGPYQDLANWIATTLELPPKGGTMDGQS